MKQAWIPVIVIASLAVGGCVTSPRDGATASPREASEYNVQLGLEYLNQGRRDLAMEKLLRAVEQDPRSAQAHLALAYAYNHYGDETRAAEHHRRALRLEPDNPSIQNTYGAFLCQHGDLRGAERQFLAAARNSAYTTPQVAWTNAGICAEREPDLAKAERYYREALRVDQRHADALWQMAQLSYNIDNPLQARAFLQRYMEVSRLSAEIAWLGYRVETALGDREAAERYAARLRGDFADSDEARELEEMERDRGR